MPYFIYGLIHDGLRGLQLDDEPCSDTTVPNILAGDDLEGAITMLATGCRILATVFDTDAIGMFISVPVELEDETRRILEKLMPETATKPFSSFSPN